MAHNNLTIPVIQERLTRSKNHQMYRPEVIELDNDAMVLAIKVHMCPEFERQPDTGQWHGGVMSSLVDITGCYTLMLVAGGQMLTLNFAVDFLRLATSETLIARGKVKRVGRTIGFVDVEIEDEDGRVVVAGHACYAIRADIPQD